MVCMVDVKLRFSTVLLVRSVLKEEQQDRFKGGKEYGIKDGNKDEDIELAVRNKMSLFYAVIRATVEKRLEKYAASELENLVLTSVDFFAQGHGSMEICEPPTAAQNHIVKSLIKVIFHQLTVNAPSEAINEAHANLIFSLFIKRISCDVFLEDADISGRMESPIRTLEERITKILCKENDEFSSNRVEEFISREMGGCSVHLFCCLEDLEVQNENRILVDDFDKIDLYGEGSNDEGDSDDGNTLTSLGLGNQLANKIQISKQTLSLAKFTLLPSKDLDNLWESLYFEGNIKQKMYSYATIALKMASLSNSKFDKTEESSAVFSNNKLLLVHGPPGTGKTTICKALVQKLSIRKEFTSELDPIDAMHKGILVEISCSRIFSRWFGESSKNLVSIFTDVENLLKANEKTNSFVCLLIDEVEAIAFSRDDLLNKNESTDGVRVVSALLTQLDRLKKYNNFLVLATSNLLNSLDPAFVDRADGVFYIGNPSQSGIFEILNSSLKDLIIRNIISCPNSEPGILANQSYKVIMGLITAECLVCHTHIL